MRKTLISILVAFAATIFLLFSSSTMVISDSSQSSRPVLIVGDDIDYPPFSYLDQNGEPAGFNIELAKYLGNELGYDVEFRLDEWSKIRVALEKGEIDLVSGMCHSSEREQSYDFTARHSIIVGDIFTSSGTRVQSLEELRGKTVVVQKDEIIGESLRNMNIGVKLKEVPTLKAALQTIAHGENDYAALAKLPALYRIDELNLNNIQPNNLKFTTEDYCMAVLEGNETLLYAVNNRLQLTKATGEYQKIYDQWLGIYEAKNSIERLMPYAWVLFVIIGFVLVLLIWSLLLKRAVTKKTEELRESEQLKEAIINAIPDLIFIFNLEGKYVNCLAGCEHDLLCSKELLIGNYIDSVLPESIATQLMEHIQTAFTKSMVQQFEYKLEIAGNTECFEMRIAHIHDDKLIGLTRNVTNERLNQERIAYLSYHDQLTGLYNRHYFEKALTDLDNEDNLPLGIVLIDVNGLKLVNDSFGHLVGDELLVRVAEVLKEGCDKGDVISRIGGDEFVILLPKKDFVQVEKVIRQIKDICLDEKVSAIDLSISLGYEIKHSINQDICETFTRAEEAMYRKKLYEGPSIRSKTIDAIIQTLHEKNWQAEQHSRRVSDLSYRLAKAYGFTTHQSEEVRTLGLLHDIGKIAINEDILNKPGKLTLEEMEDIKRHPEIGYRILSSVNEMAEMAEHVLSHHERWDGTGYPRGLIGELIPLQARIIAIADAFDAMTSERSYRSPMTEGEAVSELLNHSGTQFDPELIQHFVENVLDYETQKTLSS